MAKLSRTEFVKTRCLKEVRSLASNQTDSDQSMHRGVHSLRYGAHEQREASQGTVGGKTIPNTQEFLRFQKQLLPTSENY